MQIIRYPEKKDWNALLKRPARDASDLEKKVEKILKNVRKKGDKALFKYTNKFDGVVLDTIQVTEQEISEADEQVSSELKEAIKLAAANIETFHRFQIQRPDWIVTMPG